MKYLFIVLALSLAFEISAFSETPSPAPVITATVTTPSPAPTVSVPTPAAPPQWAQELIVTAEKLPLIGPYVSKALMYLGIVSAILTTLVAAILAVLNSLTGVFNMTGLTNAATLVAKFRDGEIMYWIQFFSVFNAKKPGSPS